MDLSKPLFSGTVGAIVGTLGVLTAGASTLLPDPWNYFVGVAGVLAAALAGMSARPPTLVEGRPILQGAALVVAGGLGALLVQAWPMIPVGWPQAIALTVAAVISRLTGHALPMLGSTPQLSPGALHVTFVADSRNAAEILTRAGR